MEWPEDQIRKEHINSLNLANQVLIKINYLYDIYFFIRFIVKLQLNYIINCSFFFSL